MAAHHVGSHPGTSLWRENLRSFSRRREKYKRAKSDPRSGLVYYVGEKGGPRLCVRQPGLKKKMRTMRNMMTGDRKGMKKYPPRDLTVRV